MGVPPWLAPRSIPKPERTNWKMLARVGRSRMRSAVAAFARVQLSRHVVAQTRPFLEQEQALDFSGRQIDLGFLSQGGDAQYAEAIGSVSVRCTRCQDCAPEARQTARSRSPAGALYELRSRFSVNSSCDSESDRKTRPIRGRRSGRA